MRPEHCVGHGAHPTTHRVASSYSPHLQMVSLRESLSGHISLAPSIVWCSKSECSSAGFFALMLLVGTSGKLRLLIPMLEQLQARWGCSEDIGMCKGCG